MILTLGSKKLIFSPNLRHFIKGMNCNYHNSQEKKVKKDGCKPKLMKQMQWAEYMYVCGSVNIFSVFSFKEIE